MPRIEKEFVVHNAQGLHARPAALFVQIAVRYNAAVSVTKEKETVNGKSIMGILMLGAQENSKIVVAADGDDAEAFMQEIEEFLSREE